MNNDLISRSALLAALVEGGVLPRRCAGRLRERRPLKQTHVHSANSIRLLV